MLASGSTPLCVDTAMQAHETRSPSLYRVLIDQYLRHSGTIPKSIRPLDIMELDLLGTYFDNICTDIIYDAALMLQIDK